MTHSSASFAFLNLNLIAMCKKKVFCFCRMNYLFLICSAKVCLASFFTPIVLTKTIASRKDLKNNELFVQNVNEKELLKRM
jgi:hypothetical protein